jgi:hypothetical protein
MRGRRQPSYRFDRGSSFGRHARRRVRLPVMENPFSSAVQGRGRHAEHVLDRHGHAHLFMVLGFAQADQEIAILVGMVQVEGGKDIKI